MESSNETFKLEKTVPAIKRTIEELLAQNYLTEVVTWVIRRTGLLGDVQYATRTNGNDWDVQYDGRIEPTGNPNEFAIRVRLPDEKSSESMFVVTVDTNPDPVASVHFFDTEIDIYKLRADAPALIEQIKRRIAEKQKIKKTYSFAYEGEFFESLTDPRTEVPKIQDFTGEVFENADYSEPAEAFSFEAGTTRPNNVIGKNPKSDSFVLFKNESKLLESGFVRVGTGQRRVIESLSKYIEQRYPDPRKKM